MRWFIWSVIDGKGVCGVRGVAGAIGRDARDIIISVVK